MPADFQQNQLPNIYSEEVEEIVGQAPRRITRWGTSVFLLTLTLIISTSFVVMHTNVIVGDFTLTATSSPKSVVARVDGRLVKIFSKENDWVSEGSVLGYLESNADHLEIIGLTNKLQQFWKAIQDDKWDELITEKPEKYRKLGELQSAYQVFIASYLQLHAYLSQGIYAKKKNLLLGELGSLSILKESLLKTEAINLKELEIAQADFTARKKLFEDKVIPLLEYKQEESKLLSKRLPIENIRSSISNNNTLISKKQHEIIELEEQYTSQKSHFLQALNTLISQVDEWKRKYLLISPIAGRVSFPVLLQEKQEVTIGRELFYIIPTTENFYGEILVPQENFGKVRLDQIVLVSLTGFPYQEFGKLKGRITFISNFPNKENQYYIGIKFENGLHTDMNQTILSRNGLTGTAEIIIGKTRLINKFLSSFRKILNRPKTKKVKSATNAVEI